jgi:acetyltransferase-like isoleucine patch superfamily enzyme
MNYPRSLIKSIFNRLPIRAQCRISSSFRYRPLQHFENAFIHRTVQILGSSNVRIGLNSVISQDCWLNVNHRKSKSLAIVIGDHCFIGRRNFFSSGRSIEIGSYVLTANDCQFLGSSHVVDNPMIPCIASGTTASDIIRIGHNTFLGAGVRILGNVSIGHGCVIGAGSLVTKDILPFSQAFGSPAVVRRRFSPAQNKWLSIDEFGLEDESSIPSPDEYRAILDMNPRPRMPYMAAGNDMGNL